MPSNKLLQLAHDLMCRLVHGNGLVCNTCRKDPRLDREPLGLEPGSRVVVIASPARTEPGLFTRSTIESSAPPFRHDRAELTTS